MWLTGHLSPENNDWTISAHSCGPWGLCRWNPPSTHVPATWADGKLVDEGNKACLLLQPPTVAALLNRYIFFIFFIFTQSFLKFAPIWLKLSYNKYTHLKDILRFSHKKFKIFSHIMWKFQMSTFRLKVLWIRQEVIELIGQRWAPNQSQSLLASP